MGYQETYTKEIVKVLELGPAGARCTTQYGSEITVSWGAHLPNPAPSVGEMWLIEKYSLGKWTFISKMNSGRYSVMSLWMELDARTCVGTERLVADDMAATGIDGVYLKVADGGVVMWDSEVAKGMGLAVMGDHVTQIIDRLRYHDLAVVLVIGDTLWSDTSDAIHAQRQQCVLEGGVVKQTGKLSWEGAARDVTLLVDELFEKYGTEVRGVCIDGLSAAGESGDFSVPMRKRFYDLFGRMPGEDMAARPATNRNEWWSRRLEWQQVHNASLGDMIAGMRGKVGNWPISVKPAARAVTNSSSGVKTGRLSTFLDDDFAKMGWSSVIVPIEQTRQADATGELRSFEFCLAQAIRFARGAAFSAHLDIGRLRDPKGAFEVLSKYDVKSVVLGGYEKWRLLSDSQVLEIKAAVGEFKVSDVNNEASVGLLESHDSRDWWFYSVEDNDRYCRSEESMAFSLLELLPHKIRILYDEDVEWDKGLSGLSSAIMLNAQGISDRAITKVEELVNGGVTNVAVIGDIGGSDGGAEDVRILKAFEAAAYGDVNYGVDLTVDDLFDVADTRYAVYGKSVGGNLVIGEPSASSSVEEWSGDSSVWRGTSAPVIIRNRSALMAMDVTRDDSLMDAAAHLAAYTVGREH